ncbi:Exopolyphosphatase [Planctomycetes bacterium Pla163]|uniref:Exopolyphosphatase n=1 Tax=Rohdeia mirabilis TaxID=2528008 RepID=A0A518D001_9BACT|nr:Exopolyphosphatase [Planctomycetes bacterium Pla163]
MPPPSTTPADDSLIGALDLGSNSFHLILGRLVDEQIVIIDRLREPVRMGAGLGRDRTLDEATQVRALECLARMGERLRGVAPDRLRIVGTNTLRRARNARRFVARAEEVLGHEIEILPGLEEARLIYLGVAHSITGDPDPRLVIDIGGGSTEVILGRSFDIVFANSLAMGCVAFASKYFPNGEITEAAFERAVLKARRETVPVAESYVEHGFNRVVGSSGTARAIERILRENGWTKGGIDRAGLARLRREVLRAGRVNALDLPGLSDDRKPVLASGLAVLLGLVEELGIERIETTSGAMREGLLYDLIGRLRHDDLREHTIARLEQRYAVDLAQSRRVERCARKLVGAGAGAALGLDSESLRFLSWGARLHEVGQALRYGGYHRHGAYLIAESHLPGFSEDDQNLLSLLVLLHRRRLDLVLVEERAPARVEEALALALVLRLAVVLCRARGATPVPAAGLTTDAGDPHRLVLTLENGLLERAPLLRADLESEIEAFGRVGFDLAVQDATRPTDAK